MIPLLLHIQNARDSLKANRARTLLTVTGVAIGIASIVTVLSLASGATYVVAQQVDEVGGNIAVIRPGYEAPSSSTDLVNRQVYKQTDTSSLTKSDLKRIATIPSVTAHAPVMLIRTTLTGDTAKTADIVGTTPDLLMISHIEMKEGEFIESENAPIVIGAQLSIDLFGTEDSLGKTVTVKDKTFYVGGILERQENPMNFNGVDFDNAALLSPTQITAINPTAQIQQINIQTESVATLDRAIIDVNKALLAQHNNELDFRVLRGEEIAAPTSQLFTVVAGVTAAIASVSLFVGGIGIMNIMLVNVAERTREIGIRKALGASRSDIMWQFLIESIIMALIGGVFGGLLGLASAFVIGLFLTFTPVITWPIVAIAIGTAGIVGVLFGLYPALRAARKNPIEALNQYT